MVHLETHRKLKKHLHDNFLEYVKNHPGEYVMLKDTLKEGIKATFYASKAELDKILKKYKGTVGCTFLTEHIPVKTHRFNENNKTLEFRLNQHVTKCPNDNETELVGMAPVEIERTDGRHKYTQQAYCPDCGYKVFRKCSAETIKQVKENMNKLVIK
jgi:hypothetical protein